MLASILVVIISWSVVRYAASTPVLHPQCNPAQHICEGKCPSLPPGVVLPSPDQKAGICLRDMNTDACVCWMHNPTKNQYLYTAFRCEAAANGTSKPMLCFAPSICFPPGLGCLIMLHCPCKVHAAARPAGSWLYVDASIHRSDLPVIPNPDSAPFPVDNATPTSATAGDSREFSLKHLLFLLAFVIAPLVCWCLLTFFHEGKCRKKRRSPAPQPTASAPSEEAAEELPQPGSLLLPPPQQPQPPQSPKFESPPPYREAVDPSESCLLAADCGPPPSYEDAIRGQFHASMLRAPEPDSD